MSDLIRRDDVNDLIKQICDACGEGEKYNGVMCRCCRFDDFIGVVDNIPSAEPERIIKIGQRSGKTLESAIDFLQSTGWLQEHDRILTESVKPERKKGKWSNYKDEHCCSVCKCVVISDCWDDEIRYDYCPYCGAEMRGE